MVLPHVPPVDLPTPLRVAFERDDVRDAELFHAVLAVGGARERAVTLLALGSWHLRRGEGIEASRWLTEGLAVTRSQRLARPVRPHYWLALSHAARLSGAFEPARAYAVTAHRAAKEPGDRAAALLAQATALRLSGDAWGSLTPVHAALHEQDSAASQVARTLTWLALTPSDTESQAAQLAGQVGGTLRSRLAWHLTEAALTRQDDQTAERWLPFALSRPFTREEARLAPLTAARLGLTFPVVHAARSVQVLTLERQGLLHGERFIPVPGDGRLLALVAFLIHGGPTHWERAADAVLGSGSRAGLYTQVRHHLSTLRALLGHPEAITSRRGLLSLDSTWAWSCDALNSTGPAARHSWLPALNGWWVQQQRAQLSAKVP